VPRCAQSPFKAKSKPKPRERAVSGQLASMEVPTWHKPLSLDSRRLAIHFKELRSDSASHVRVIT